jgi:hypothetical protein
MTHDYEIPTTPFTPTNLAASAAKILEAKRAGVRTLRALIKQHHQEYFTERGWQITGLRHDREHGSLFKVVLALWVQH